ncbi:TPA: hypothetical protein ACRMRV_006294, partial [Pseudomonas aeruginosa]
VLWVIAVLAGCATTAKYENVLNSWVGSSEIDLIRAWGPPQQAYNSGESRFITYTNSSNIYMPGVSPSYTTTYYGNTAYTTSSGGSPAQNIPLSCTTTFELKNGVILSWQWQGNHCVAR